MFVFIIENARSKKTKKQTKKVGAVLM